MAARLVKLLRANKVVEGNVLMTGGLALDIGLRAALNEELADRNVTIEAFSHPDSIYAGAIGAAIWGAFRHDKLARLGQLAKAS
jgi:benzoyl-CoA reductase subunit D